MLTFRVRSLRDIFPEVQILSELNFKETSIFRKDEVLDINWNVYAQFEQLGMLACCGAYDGNKLVGYAAVICTNHPHHKNIILGVVQVIFLEKEYRRGRNGIELISFVEHAALALGANHITFNIPKDQKRLHPLLINLGYSVKEIAYMKGLKNGKAKS